MYLKIIRCVAGQRHVSITEVLTVHVEETEPGKPGSAEIKIHAESKSLGMITHIMDNTPENRAGAYLMGESGKTIDTIFSNL